MTSTSYPRDAADWRGIFIRHLAAALGVPSLVLFDARHLDWRPWWPGAGVRTVTLTAMVDEEVADVIADLEARLR